MPEQTKLTPHILDFVEQSMLSMPPRVTMVMQDLSNQADVSYEEYLQAISSVDVVVHVRVESSQVYLQSCDANEMAADCLFVLPEVCNILQFMNLHSVLGFVRDHKWRLIKVGHIGIDFAIKVPAHRFLAVINGT